MGSLGDFGSPIHPLAPPNVTCNVTQLVYLIQVGSRTRERPLRFASSSTLGLVAFAATALALSPDVGADSWRLPKKTRYCSANGQYCVIVIPRPIDSALDAFDAEIVDPASGKEARLFPEFDSTVSPGKPPDPPAPVPKGCKAVFSRRTPVGERDKVEFDLLNDIAPVNVLVADNGEYVVTLDNWHLKGYGPTTVTIYRADGTLVRYLGLDELLSPADIAGLPRSVSSIHWYDTATIDDAAGVLRLGIRSHYERTCDGPAEVAISLRDGQPTHPMRDMLLRWRVDVRVVEAPEFVTATGNTPFSCDGISPEDVGTVPSIELLGDHVQLAPPAYPELPRVARVSGEIPVELVVGENGHVLCARALVNHNLGFSDTSLSSAIDWRFRPSTTRRRGQLLVRFETWAGCDGDEADDKQLEFVPLAQSDP